MIEKDGCSGRCTEYTVTILAWQKVISTWHAHIDGEFLLPSIYYAAY